MAEKENYIHKKLAAEEVLRYIKRDRVHFLVIVVCAVLLGGLPQSANIIRMAIAVAVIIFVGLQLIFDLKTEKRMTMQYILPTKEDLKID